MARIAKSVPLNGLPEYMAKIETDTTGRHNRIAISLFEGFQWNKREMMRPYIAKCHMVAINTLLLTIV